MRWGVLHEENEAEQMFAWNSRGHATKRGLRVPNPNSRGHATKRGLQVPYPNSRSHATKGGLRVPNPNSRGHTTKRGLETWPGFLNSTGKLATSPLITAAF